MRAIIIGAGNAGRNLATKLCQEKHDVILIDKSAQALESVASQLDILTIQGHGASPAILVEADIEKADLVVGLTNSDDVNVLTCIQAKNAGVPYKVARIANTDYMVPRHSFDLKKLGVDLAINPREECAQEICNTLRLPGTQEVIDMLDRKVYAIGIRLHEDSPLLGAQLANFPRPELLDTIRFVAIMRDKELIIPYGDTEFLEGDEVYVVGQPDDIEVFLEWTSPNRLSINKVVIAGAGELGLKLAQMLEKQHMQVVLIENDEQRAQECASVLSKTLIMKGNSLEIDILQEAGFTEQSGFVAATGDDENNIIGCLLAEKMGARYTIAQVTQPEYVPIINSLNLLKRSVSTHLSTINSILHFVRGKNVKAASIMHTLPGELLEIDLTAESAWTNKIISKLRMPGGSIIATVMRDEKILAATGDLKLEEGDRLVVFSTPKAVNKLKTVFSK